MTKQTVQSFEEYADLVRRSGLVERETLERVIAEFDAPGSPSADCTPLAKRLLEEKLITNWQNGHLVEGRSKGFFLGKYKLLSFLGTGGMSTVYLAEHVMMKRRVAIKVLTEAQVDRTTLERFRRECRAVASLDHRNIVRAHDFDSDGKFHYLVMEYVKGCDLEALVEKQGPLTYRLAADYLRQACDGLAHAHNAGMIHRDIKPSNLLLGSKGVVKLLDLGVAKIAQFESSKLTVDSHQNLLGTVDFLAPEQALNSSEVDARADVYSLGCTLFFFITGQPPFATGTQAQRLLAHQIQPPPDIRRKRPDCPQSLIDICLKMLAKKPEQRFQSARAVSEALENFLATYQEGSAIETDNIIEATQARETASTTDTRANNNRRTVAVSQPMTRVVCAGCNSAFGAPAQVANRRIKCPHCGTLIFVPGTPHGLAQS